MPRIKTSGPVDYKVGVDSVAVLMKRGEMEHDYTFSVCTLLASDANYERSLASFRKFGFTDENTQFLAADNRQENNFDGYAWVRRMLPECRGKYIVFCHDDVELVDDDLSKLKKTLEELTEIDPKWSIAGNAGGLSGWTRDQKRFRMALRISDRSFDNAHLGDLPARCESLDENFIVMRRDNPVTRSTDLSGFHLFGTDLCLRAELAGQSSYVIDFHLYHHGQGAKGKHYRQQKARIEAKYCKIFPGRRVSTSTEILSF